MKKNIIIKFLMAVVLILGLTSCEDRDLVTIDNVATPVVMDLSTNSLVLDENFPTNHALTVSWTPAEYTVPVAMNYILEISKDEAFANPVELGRTQNVKFLSFTVKDLNEAAKAIGLVAYEPQKMYFRVKSYLGEGDMYQISNVTSLTITPYIASPTYNYTDLYLIGNATAGGWDNVATNMNLFPLLKTANSNVYTFTGLFKVGGFKVIKVKGDWGAQFGYGGSAGTLSTDGGSGDIQVAEEGYYKLTIDTAALTYTFVPVTVPTTTYSSVSIFGSVNGNWDTDTQLTQSTFDPHVWMATNLHLKDGEFKFRANNNWDVSWGTDSEFFGTATLGGSNIPLSSEWDYHVYFNDATGDYTLIPLQ